jgi:hypothetical protein
MNFGVNEFYSCGTSLVRKTFPRRESVAHLRHTLASRRCVTELHHAVASHLSENNKVVQGSREIELK